MSDYWEDSSAADLRAALMAACTSRAAASMLRFRSNCRTMLVVPSWLVEVIWLMPAIRPNWRSSGVATAEAMVSGLAPGSPRGNLDHWKFDLRQGSDGQKLEGERSRQQHAPSSAGTFRPAA